MSYIPVLLVDSRLFQKAYEECEELVNERDAQIEQLTEQLADKARELATSREELEASHSVVSAQSKVLVSARRFQRLPNAILPAQAGRRESEETT